MRTTPRWAIAASTFAFTLAVRVWRIDRTFWLLGDQIRDWSIALGSFRDLPLVGPPTHVGGYTIGPAFYWILWTIRVTLGPFFDNLPHAGGIGQALVQSAADTMLLVAVWRRTGSVWLALSTAILLATAAYDLCLSAIVWNPTMGAALAKIATALVLFGGTGASASMAAATVAVAWAAVQAYTGAIFAAIGVIGAVVLGPLAARRYDLLRRNAWIAALVVAALQVPHALYQVSTGFRDSGMGAVTGSLSRVLAGTARPRLAGSWAGYADAVDYIQIAPWSAPWILWVLAACALVVAAKFRRDPAVLSVTLVPQIAAVVGYAFYVGDFLDHYYYFSLMPAAVLTVVLALAALPSAPLVRAAGIGLLVLAVAIAPARIRLSWTMHRMPEYGTLVDASRRIARRQQPMRAIRAGFPLPPTSDPAFLYTVLGGKLDRNSPWVAVIKSDGSVWYRAYRSHVITRRTLLLIVLIAAAGVRVWGIGFGLPHIIARPDETEIAGPAVGFLSGDLRPPFFEWPTLFVYAVSLLYVLYFAVTRPFSPYKTLAAFADSRRQSLAPFLYISRGLSAVMGVLTVWWVYAIGRRAFDETTGLVAALFLALCFLHVRDSHFGTTDVAMTALVVAAVLLVLRWRTSGMVADAAAAGLVGGLAASTKYNGAGVVVPFAVAAVQRMVEEWRSGGTPGRALGRLAGASAAFGVALLSGFFGASPYVLIDWERFRRSIAGVQSHVMQGHGIVLGTGWGYYADVVLPAALGWPLFAAGVVGMLAMLVRRPREGFIILAFPIAYYAVAGRGFTVFARYIIPVLPFICIAAAWLVVSSTRAMTPHNRPLIRRGAIAAASLALVAPGACKSVLLDRLLAATDNRVVVAEALSGIVASGETLYQSGETYGYVPMQIHGHDIARVRRYAAAQAAFDGDEPDWILLQRSPLQLYSSVPEPIERLVVRRYRFVRGFPAGGGRADRLYDQQDAFFLPLAGLRGLSRPGPSFELYARRRDLSPAR